MTWSWILTEAIASPQIHKVVISIFHMVQMIPNMNVVSPQPAAISGLGRSNIFAKKRMPMGGAPPSAFFFMNNFYQIIISCASHILCIPQNCILASKWILRSLYHLNLIFMSYWFHCPIIKSDQTVIL